MIRNKETYKKRLIVFLDIDGVIATKKSLDRLWKEYMGKAWSRKAQEDLDEFCLNWPHTSMYHWPFDRNSCKHIHEFQRSFKGVRVEYVICSTWRYGRTLQEMDELFTQKGLLLNNIIGKTPTGMKRGEEINKWLEDNNEIQTPFLVFDDDCYYDIHPFIDEKHLIDTPFKDGFNKEKLAQAIEKANKLL